MNAPDKIYMTPSYGEPDNVLLASFSKSHLDCHRDIEYIRKEAVLALVDKLYDEAPSYDDSRVYLGKAYELINSI